MDAVKYHDLRDFLMLLEQQDELKHISLEVGPHLETTEVTDRTLRADGPVLLSENPKGYSMPVLYDLFDTPKRAAMGMRQEGVSTLREVGKLLAFLKESEPPRGFRDLFDKLPQFKQVLNMPTKRLRGVPCQQKVYSGDDTGLDRIPIMTYWPEGVVSLITWGLTVTRDLRKERQNLDIYRQQLIGKNKLIMRWLSHRDGTLNYQGWCIAYPDERSPVSVALGADPATILEAMTPIPDTLSEYALAGLLHDTKTEVIECISNDLEVPASAETVLEGYVEPGELAPEGPYGDHTGYYNEINNFPVFTVTHITQRGGAIYRPTYTGRPPDGPAVLDVALNEAFVPILQKQFPEIVDFYLPPEDCSYRLAVMAMKEQYAGRARRVMMGVWSFLRQFVYTKFVIVYDDDVSARDWDDMIWIIITRMDPARDTVLAENTPIDYLDFVSPVSGLDSKMGLDATNEWSGETQHEWGRPIKKDPEVTAHIDAIWDKLAIFNDGKSAWGAIVLSISPTERAHDSLKS